MRQNKKYTDDINCVTKIFQRKQSQKLSTGKVGVKTTEEEEKEPQKGKKKNESGSHAA